MLSRSSTDVRRTNASSAVGEPRHDFGAEVVGKEAVAPRRQRAPALLVRIVPRGEHRERHEAHAGGPAFGPAVELRELLDSQVEAEPSDGERGLARREPELRRLELGEVACGAQPCDRQPGARRPVSASVEPGGRCSATSSSATHRIVRVDEVGVVEDQQDGLRRRRERGRHPWQRRARHRRAGVAQLVEDGRIDADGPVEGGRKVPDEDGGIVVALVDCQPGAGAAVTARPLRADGRLPVAGGCDDRDDRPLGDCSQPVDERRSRHGAGFGRRDARASTGRARRASPAALPARRAPSWRRGARACWSRRSPSRGRRHDAKRNRATTRTPRAERGDDFHALRGRRSLRGERHRAAIVTRGARSVIRGIR